MLESLKRQVFEANMLLSRLGLALFTWGNVSAIDRASGLVVIKPSGAEYDKLTEQDMVVVDLNGVRVDGKLNPSSDTPTHVALYRAFPSIGGITHTHSTHATAWAQAGRPIPPLGTAHADTFCGCVPCTRRMSPAEIGEDYEKSTGLVITETFAADGLDPLAMPGVLVASHGPFTWGRDAIAAVHNAAVLEEVAHMACLTGQIVADFSCLPELQKELIDRRYMRKHGARTYYG